MEPCILTEIPLCSQKSDVFIAKSPEKHAILPKIRPFQDANRYQLQFVAWLLFD